MNKDIIHIKPSYGLYLKRVSTGIASPGIDLIWDKVLKNGPSKICGKRPLRNLKDKQTTFLQIF